MEQSDPASTEPQPDIKSDPTPAARWLDRLSKRCSEDAVKTTPRDLIIAMTIHAMFRGSSIGTVSQTPEAMLDRIADVAIDMADAVQRAQDRRCKVPKAEMTGEKRGED